VAQAVLYVELVPTTTGIKRNIEKELDGTFSSVEKRGTSVFSKIGGLAKGVAVAAAAAAATLAGLAIKGGFERMLKIEDAQAKLDGLGHSTATVEKIMGSALDAVKGTAYGLDTAATLAASAVAAGIKPGQELEKYLRLTADAATIAGISMEEMGSIINKVNANGKAMTENLNQLSDRGIPILQWLAEEYGVTTAEMSKMVSQGKVDAETFNKVLQENIGGAALKSGETTRGAFANMLAALSRVGVALIEDVFPHFKTVFNDITGLLDGLVDKIGPLRDAVAEKLGPIAETIGGAFAGMGEAVTPFLEKLAPLAELAGYFTPLGAVFQLLVPLLPQLMEPLGQIAEILADTLVAALPIVAELFASIGEVLGGVLVAALPVITDLISRLAVIFEQIMPVILLVAGVIGDILVVALDALMPIIDLVLQLLDPLMSIFEALITPVLAIVEALLPLVSVLIGALAPILAIVAEVVGAVLVPIIQILAGVITLLADVIVWLVEQIFVPYIQNLLIPAWEAVGAAFMWVYENIIKPMFGFLVDTTITSNEAITRVFGALGSFFSGLWDGIKAGFKAFINFVIDGINGFIAGINTVGGFISDITGGGIDVTIGQLPRLANGALVAASRGGSAAIIGEGRYDEAVVPLGGPQLEKIREALVSDERATGEGATVKVYPQEGMSEETIGRVAAEEFNWMLRRKMR
jgi:tape measure domain-containing protein